MKLATASMLLALLVATPAFADGDAGSLLVGTNWQLTSLGAAAAADGVKSTLTIAEDGNVNGNGGCNGFGGTVKIDGSALAFSQMRSTMMACEDAAMKQEHGLHMALEATKSYKIEGEKLSLLDAGGAPVATFSAAE